MSEEPKVITDARGRKLTLRALTVVDQMRLLRAVGPEQSQNQPYVMMVECLYMVQDIDGLPAQRPVNERQIDAAGERLGDDGVAAVMAQRWAEMKATEAEAQAAIEQGQQRADPLDRPATLPSSDPS